MVGAARSPPPPTPPAHTPARHASIKVVVHPARSSLRSLPMPGHAPDGVVPGAAPASLPVPPQPPAQAFAGEPAPVPDADLGLPTPGAQRATFHVRIFSLDEHASGLGFIPGSAYPAPEDRKPMQTPGITVSVPMQ